MPGARGRRLHGVGIRTQTSMTSEPFSVLSLGRDSPELSQTHCGCLQSSLHPEQNMSFLLNRSALPCWKRILMVQLRLFQAECPFIGFSQDTILSIFLLMRYSCEAAPSEEARDHQLLRCDPDTLLLRSKHSISLAACKSLSQCF